MSHSYTRQLLHIVFSTKERQPFLHAEVRPRMLGYLRTVANDLNTTVLALNGVDDHVHILVDLPAALSTAEFLTKLKANSSRWFRKLFPKVDFRWQRGYGAFSVSPSKLEEVRGYIDRQETHHQKHSFEEEIRKLVKNHGLEFDERFFLG
ncbi:MAG: IS200/IS605 family transposase [Planctomycetota bacterium]|nr:IS200/IS605 family transposase [Planctomycetota bacterium]